MFLTIVFPLRLMYRISYFGFVTKCFRGSFFPTISFLLFWGARMLIYLQ